jgi:cytochrome c-type biogenesis protein CcsB
VIPLETATLFGAMTFIVVSLLLHLLTALRVTRRDLFKSGLVVLLVGWLLLTVSLGARAAQTGHGPFTNMYEFTVAFAWGVLGVLLLFVRRYRLRGVAIGGELISFVLLFCAYWMPSRPVPLVPALQNSLLLSLHVAAAVVAYGSFAVAFVAALMLVRKPVESQEGIAQDAAMLEELSYRAAAVGFPAMTLVIVLGALWADVAWGRYWGWDPKETASLVAWLIYAGYLHARVLRGWRGRRAALLLVLGFIAVVLTFFGNYVFQSLHAYQ